MKVAAVRKRTGILQAGVIGVAALCAAQLINVQLVQGPELAAEAMVVRARESEIPAQRGDIVDAKGTVLATSQLIYDVGVTRPIVASYIHGEWFNDSGQIETDPAKRNERNSTWKVVGTGALEAAKQLAPLLDMDPAILGGMMIGERSFSYLKKGVDHATFAKIEELGIPGIQGDERYLRVYPNEAIASTIVGYTDIDNKGLAGIELTMDEDLQGVPGFRQTESGPRGQAIPDGVNVVTPAKQGSQVHLSIDSDLNNIAQQIADDTQAKFGADWVTIVVEEVGTGRLLALADSGAMNPIAMRKGEGTQASRAVQYTYEPGSVGKLVTFADAIEQKKVNPLTPFTVPYRITMPNGQSFKDSHDHPTMQMTVAGVLAESSNTGTVQIGDTVSDESRFELMQKFGWGEPTGIEMPGETRGIITPPGKWDQRQRYTTMFGQGVATSPLQTTSLVSTLANGGVRMPVRIVDGVTDPNGIYHPAEKDAPVRVVNADTAATLIRMMEAVTSEEGTADKAAIPGYRTAGKTGTTEILSGGGGVVSSFVGVAPAEAPRVATSVVVYRPRSGIWGGVVAAPAFSQVTGQALRVLQVPPSTEPAQLYPLRPGQ